MMASATPGQITGPLVGLRVLDLATLFAAPALAGHLGDLGADVVKVEPPTGDPQRFVGSMRDGRSLAWSLVGRNKRSVTVDHTSSAGRALLARLTEVADVVVTNQPDQILDRWECTYDQIALRNPRAVVVSMSVFGADGPYSGRPGNGTVAEAFGGFTHMTGEPDRPPVLPSAPLGDYLAAMAGAMVVISACYWRDARGGSGQYIDLAMYEPVVSLLGTAMVGWEPGTPAPVRSGSRYPGGAPRNVYRTALGDWVVVAGPTDAQVARVLVVIDADTAANRNRFGTAQQRMTTADELDSLVAEWIANRATAEVVEAFSAARIPVAPVNDLASLAGDPHVEYRGSITTVDTVDFGPVMMPAPSPRFGATPTGIAWPGPALGQHNTAVYRDWLGIDSDELAVLRSTGAL
jgi:crotonobetainyl-CoA:carnitine CoA-transferase CaiB-like acyl-CoA transferase